MQLKYCIIPIHSSNITWCLWCRIQNGVFGMFHLTGVHFILYLLFDSNFLWVILIDSVKSMIRITIAQSHRIKIFGWCSIFDEISVLCGWLFKLFSAMSLETVPSKQWEPSVSAAYQPFETDKPHIASGVELIVAIVIHLMSGKSFTNSETAWHDWNNIIVNV